MQESFKIWKLVLSILAISALWLGIPFCTEASVFPELSVDYTGIINVIEERSSPENINKNLQNNGLKIRSSDNEVFMNEENAINIQVKVNQSESDKDEPEESTEGNYIESEIPDDTDSFNAEDVKIELYRIQYGEKDIEQRELLEEKSLEKEGQSEDGLQEKFICSIRNLKEGHYKVIIKYEERKEENTEKENMGKEGAFILAEDDDETDACMKEGYYESPICTVDTKIPVITEAFYNQNVTGKNGKRQYFQKAPQIVIRIKEENFNKYDFDLEGRMFYANGNTMREQWKELESKIDGLKWESYYKDGIRINEVKIQVEEEANYILRFKSTDKAGNASNLKEMEFTYDCTKPEVTYTGLDNVTGDLIFKAADNGTDISKLIFRKYNFFRYFSPVKIDVFVRVKDAVSGVERIKYDFIPYDENSDVGIDDSVYLKNRVVGKERIREQQTMDGDLSEMVILVSPEQKNFKGYLRACGQDYSGNTGSLVESKGVISETAQLHKKISDISINLPKAFFTDKKKKINYYNKAVQIYADFKDGQSGIYKTSLYAGKDAGMTMMWDGETITYQKRQSLILNPEESDGAAVEYPLVIEAQMEDNAGHVDRQILDDKIVIDTVKPEIKVTYDHDKKEECYNTSRKATVTVKEKNFNSDLVKWNIQGSNQKYRIGEWQNVRGVHICEVYFEEEGEKYAINLSVTDFAGNKAEWKDKVSFSIDKTAPKVSVNLNNEMSDLEETESLLNKKKNQKQKVSTSQNFINNTVEEVRYFNQKQTVIFCIQDKNFDENRIEYSIEAIAGKKKISIEGPDKYTKKGDRYYSKLILEKEARYHVVFRCADKAGNESETKQLEDFVIDTTAPKVIVTGVKNNEVYEEKKVMPRVLCEDENLDVDAVKFRLCKADGSEVTEKEWTYEQINNENTVQRQWMNLDNEKKGDGIYQLFVEASDKAGNKLKDDGKIIFRVNRWGAEFVLDDSVKQKLEKYYLKESPEIILRERCVKPTKSKVIILKDNEDRSTLNSESIKRYVIADKTSPRYGWYEKIYNVEQKNFEREGDYQISFQSDLKEKKLHFIVDKTPPAVNIGNLDEEIYEEAEHEFTVSVMDNYAFKKLELYIEESGGVGKPKSVEKRVIKPEDLDKNYTIREKLIKSGKKQTVRYIAWDKAGNKTDSENNGDIRRCYVTENKALKGYYKHNGKSGKHNKGIKTEQKTGITKVAGITLLGMNLICAGKYLFAKRKQNNITESMFEEEKMNE